jgi:hypothetical protein
VRTEAEFAEAHAAGAVNAQLYRLIKEWTPWEFSKSLGALQCFLAHRFRAAACFFCHFSRFFFLLIGFLCNEADTVNIATRVIRNYTK